MKIGIFDPYLDDLGGGEKYMLTIAEHLSRDHQVAVFWDNPADLQKITERFALDLSKITLKKNIFSSEYPFFKRWFDSLGYDVIITLSDGSIPLVLSKKLLIHFQQPFSNFKLSIKAKLKQNRVHTFFCNSYFTKSFIDQEFRIKSQVIYPPVEMKAKKLQKENIILHVGRFRLRQTIDSSGKEILVDYKKQLIMARVFQQMVKQGLTDWKLVFVVSVLEKDLQQFADFQKTTRSFPIEFLINKTSSELWDNYSKAKIYWHASGFEEDLEHYPELAEHFGISTAEAMGAGAVPIVINAGGQKEIVTEGENGFLWDSLEQLQSKTLQVIKDQALWEKLSGDAQLTDQKFSKEAFCQQIEELVLK